MYAVDLILSMVTNITTNIDTTVTLQVVTHTLTHNVNKIVIAGDFTAVNGVPRNRVAVLNPDGTVDTTSFDSFGSGADSTVYDVLVQQDALRTDTRIVIAGTFKTINFNNRQGCAIESKRIVGFDLQPGIRHGRFGVHHCCGSQH